MPEQAGSRETQVDFSSGFAVLPLRDVVVYPHMVIPLFVGRDKSIAALDHATQKNQQILLVAQRRADVDEPSADDLYGVGALANILQLLKLPDGTVKVLVEGARRVRIAEFVSTESNGAGDRATVKFRFGDEERMMVFRKVDGRWVAHDLQ